MGITKELRKWLKSLYTPNSAALKAEGERIADRIDAEHERVCIDAECERIYRDLTIDAEPMTDERMAEHGWMRMPRDAVGEYIHVGDVMDGYGKTIEVVEMRYGRGGWVLISRDGGGFADCAAFSHHHEPTVEDVLREFAEKIVDSQIPNVRPTYEEAIAEYAAKLRLEGDEDE